MQRPERASRPDGQSWGYSQVNAKDSVAGKCQELVFSIRLSNLYSVLAVAVLLCCCLFYKLKQIVIFFLNNVVRVLITCSVL